MYLYPRNRQIVLYSVRSDSRLSDRSCSGPRDPEEHHQRSAYYPETWGVYALQSAGGGHYAKAETELRGWVAELLCIPHGNVVLR